MNIGIYFGSQTGTTDGIAALIGQHLGTLGHAVTVKSILHAQPDELEGHELLILGTSTWDIGELPYDWQKWWYNFERVDLIGKTAALFGLGDQYGYADTFCDAIRTLHDRVIERGGSVIGAWSTDGYDFDASTAVIDGAFIGLALDEMNQPELTPARIEAWCEHVLAGVAVAATA